MQPPTVGGLIWPARLAYTAAGLFSAASGITNLLYGIAKGTDLGTSLIWGAVSVGVSIVFALSWPALVVSVDRKQRSRAAMALVALLLTGAYSVSAALGSAMGGRANAALEAQDATDRKARAQAAYEAAKRETETLAAAKPAPELQTLLTAAQRELAALPTTRAVAELDALLAAARRDPRRFDCAFVNGSLAIACPRLAAERARAAQRSALELKIASLAGEVAAAEKSLQERRVRAAEVMDRAGADLAKVGPEKLANTDAVALSSYLQALGLNVDADRVNRLLALLAVLVIEFGGGLALAVGMALQEPAGEAPEAPVAKPAGQPQIPVLNALNTPGAAIETPRAPAFTSGVQVSSAPAPAVHAPGDIMDLVREAGGSLRTTTRRIGVQLGRPAASVHGELRRLATAGLISLNADSRGTLITVVPVPLLN